MARIPYPDPASLSASLQATLARLPQVNILRLLSHAETNAGPALSLIGSILHGQSLPPKLRELAILRVAHLTGAEYEWVQHVPMARETGVTQAQIDALAGEATGPMFDALEHDLLRFVEEMTLGVRVSDATFGALAARLPERQLVELAIAAGFYAMFARLIEVFQVELEPGAGSYSLEQVKFD
jgi:AhpD family alkylhydroperoxidase